MISPDKMLLLFAMFACSLRPAGQQDRYVEILEATSQEWISGVPGGGRGVTYRLRLRINTDKPIQFDSIWVAGKKLPARLEKAGQPGPMKIARNEVVTLLASAYKKGRPGMNGRKENQGYQPPLDTAKAPIAYQGAALLRCVVDGATKYVVVPQITALPTIYGQ